MAKWNTSFTWKTQPNSRFSHAISFFSTFIMQAKLKPDTFNIQGWETLQCKLVQWGRMQQLKTERIWMERLWANRKGSWSNTNWCWANTGMASILGYSCRASPGCPLSRVSLFLLLKGPDFSLSTLISLCSLPFSLIEDLKGTWLDKLVQLSCKWVAEMMFTQVDVHG